MLSGALVEVVALLVADGPPASQVAPAALSSAFLTSLAGVVTFSIWSLHQHGGVAPNWPTGLALGAGGLAGAYTGARQHARMPETAIRRLLAVVVVAIGIRFLWAGLAAIL
jgi:uncharacterized membrane protein YfcA